MRESLAARSKAHQPLWLALAVVAGGLVVLTACPSRRAAEEAKVQPASRRPSATRPAAPAPASEQPSVPGESSGVGYNGAMPELRITSSAFADGEAIPPKYTADGDDVNPPLIISGVPEGAQSLVLIMDDPDAPMGTWDHWIVFNIPADTSEITEDSVPAGAIQGRNSWGRSDYGGPAPPRGTHRYFFKLYALDTKLDLPAGSKKTRLEAAMKGHILADAELIGLYSR